MNERVQQALAQDQLIDITTMGRSSGQERRIEIWFHNLDGNIYITGTPGARGWYANLRAHPAFTFHLKQSTTADLPAHATPITDPDARRAIFTPILAKLDRSGDLEAWMEGSPLVQVRFDAA